jgi:beta-mannanase
VSPNASPQAKNLLCYLYSQYGNHVLSGQQETNWNANPADIGWYNTNIGKYPAVLGSDFMYRDGGSCTAVSPSTNRAIAYWNAGGIPMFRYHMGMPGSGLTCTADCYQGDNCAEPTTAPTAAFFTNVVTAGTAENTSLNAKLDYMAVQIKAMQTANVPVILAIYHETQSNGWFWWAMTTSGTSFVNLWKYTFNYLTATKGLTNIVWLMPFSGTPSAAFYPGKAYLDLSGPDTYATDQPFTTLFTTARGVIGTSVPIPLHETGLIPSPSAMFPTAAPWVLFNIWASYESDGTHNTMANIQSVYADSHTVTRDEIPNLK